MEKTKKPKHLHKVEKILGMSHAFGLINEYSIFGSGGLTGESSELEADKKAEEIRRKGVRKIAELWGLSESAEKVLIRKWVELERREVRDEEPTEIEGFFPGLCELVAIYEPKDRSDDLEIEILLGEKGENTPDFEKLQAELSKRKAILADLRQVKKGHIYLDVTEVDYKTFRKAYKAIELCRGQLGMNKRDMKRGAPESMDETRALLAAEAARRGMRREEIAEILEFNIYPAEVSNTFPLLHKYIKAGRKIADKLDKLEKYLQEITGIVV
jgi:hypothetical protein